MHVNRIDEKKLNETIAFHGHWCPGLAIGIRAAEWAISEMGKSSDEDIVAVVETDMCGVDAIQHLTGCTFGKGNLIYKDYGKNAFSFYRRSDGKAMRLVLRAAVYGDTSPLLGRLHQKRETVGLNEEEEKIWREARSTISKRDNSEGRLPEGNTTIGRKRAMKAIAPRQHLIVFEERDF